MHRFFAAVVAAVLIISASPALAQQATVAEQVVNRFLATGTASERDLLLLMSQPKEFLRYQQILKATAPGLEQQALAIRRVVFQRALARLGAGEGGGIVQAVIALGSWATELNAGDMDIIVKGGREAAKRFNQLLHEEIKAILSQEGDDVCKVVFSKGARFTLETFEIYVSTLEDFGYASLKQSFHEALEIAAKDGQAAGAAHLNKAADSIIRKNLSAQRFAAVQTEYYPGASGQDFVRDYFDKQGKSKTWRVGDNGALDSSWDAGLTANQLGDAMIKDLGLSVESMSGAFKFPVIADEMLKWGERSKLGAREQAKGLVRAYEAKPGGFLGLLTKEETRVLKAARILAKTPRENQAYIREALQSNNFASEQAFSQAGEAMLWDLTKASNNEAMHIILENQKAAVEAAKAGRDVEAQYRRIKDYLMSNEQLAGYSKLKPEHLIKLAEELPADMAFRDEMVALLEFMAEGSEKGAKGAADMAKRLVKLAFQQKRLSAEATEEAIKALRAGKEVSAEVEEVIAVLRRDLADLASIRAVSPAGDSLAECVRTSSLFSKGGLTVTPELEAMVAEIGKLSDIQLLQLGFKNSEIALLRELNAARAQGARLSAIGDALKKAAPKNYRAILKGYILEAKKAAPAALAFQGTFALWGVYSVALDPTIPEEEQRKRLGEAIYTAFPTAGLVLDGLPMAYIAYTEGGEVDSAALGQGVAFAGLEILGLVNPAAAVGLLATYATYSVTVGMIQAENDRQFITALYNALDGNTVKVQDGTRSFDISGLAVSSDPTTKLPVVIHSAAFNDLYTKRGEVLLDTGEGRKPYDRKVNEAIRDFAKRYVWTNNADLKIWEAAVKKNFPDIDLNQVESWNLGELTEQAATVTGNQFKVGARLVKRYLNQRDLLTESTLRNIRGRLFEMQTALKTVDESKKELAEIEQVLTMEKKIIPNAQAENDSFMGWLWDASSSNVTRLEQIAGIWKRYVKTYKEAVVVYGRITKVFESADLTPPTGADLFGLTGVEATDKPKIDAVFQSFQTAFDKAYQEYRGAKGGNPDPKDPFDADAWKRLLSLRMRVFLGEFQKTTQARIAALEKDIRDVLEEVKEHYRGVVDLIVTGPTEVEAMKDVTLNVAAKRAGKPADDALKNARIEWTVNQAVKNSGPTWWFSPVEETVMNITITATKEIAGKKVVLGSTTHQLKVNKPKDDKKDDKKDETMVDTAKLSFAGTASDVWEGGNYDNGSDRGFNLKRKKASSKGTGECKWEASVDATVWGKIDPSFAPSTEAEILSELNRLVESAKAWGKTAKIRPIAIGDFKGHFIDTSVKFSGGGWSDAGFRADGVEAGGRGFLIKGQRRIELGYNVGGAGCWTNEDRPFLEAQARAAQDDAKAILAGLQLVVNGSIAKTPYKGPKLDGSDMPKVTLSPPSLEKLKVGDTVKVTAEVQNDTPEDIPFTYNWGGTFDGKPEESKKKATITIKPQKPGKYDLSVSVDGQRFNMGGASLQYEVADYKVKIERVPADTKPVPVSVKTGFKATLTVDGKPASGNFIYRWQPHPEVTFDKLDASTPDVKASFPKPERVKVWVQVLETREGRQATVAESEQIEIEVVKPALELSFDPKEPWVGQELKAKLTVKPEVKEIDFRWMPVPDNAKQSLESKDGKEITFYLKDDKQAEIQVNARVPKSGEDLGEAKNTIKAKKYTVNVTGPKAMGPKPRVWKEGVGPVDVEKEIAVDQIVEFAADTQPAALTGPVKYQWTVTSGSCTVSNPTSREARATASAAGGCELTVVIRDKNDVQLGEGKGSFNATITREAIKQGQDKAKNVEDAKTKVQGAKDKVRKGDYDGAIKDAEEAGKLDPASKEAAGSAEKLRKEKETIHQQIDKAKKLMDENKFADAQKELIVASNLNGTYPPVAAANKELSDRWGKYNAEVRDKIYEVRSANEKKEFGKALEIAAAWRASTKLDPYAEEQLKQQEDWAKQRKAQKDKQIEILKAAGEKVKAYDYAGALKSYDEGFANGQNIYNGTEPEYKEAFELRNQAFTKNKRLNELIPWVRKAAEDKEYMAVEVLQNMLKTADEAIALQPNNEQLKKWREQIVARAEKTKGDNERISQGRKYLDAAGGAERSYLTNESSIQARQIQWGEQIELQQQLYLTTAIQNYTESLKYIPDANVEKKIKDLQATLEARKKYLENYRLSIALMKEGDALAQAAPREPDFEKSLPMYDQAIEKYRKSLSLYRPVNAEMVEKQMWNLDLYKHERMVKKYWADGQAVEKEGKIIEALAAYDKALASFHSSVTHVDRMWIASHAQDLRNRINGAKTWRADGEAKQKAGKIPEAIASYRQSLKLLPDAALAEHVRMLEGRQAEAGEKKAAADKLWQEGTTLFNQGRPSDALTKFKESLGYWSDATRQKYVADMEARRARAVALRDEGAKLQQGNRIPEAIAKYKESLTYWPDTGLSSHIATLEGKLKQDSDTAARKARAKQLRDEGYALQQKNQLQAAVGKYKESLAVWPDPQLEDYIRQLETKIASTSSIKAEPGPSSVLLRPGLYRIGSSGQTCELSAISPTSMRVRTWQTATPEPPESRSAFYNAGTATPLGDGVTWRTENRDVAGYCCGNNVDSEFQILSPTSFRVLRYRLWPLNSAKPGAEDLWQPTGADEWRLVGELADAPPPTTPTQPVIPPAADGKTLFNNGNTSGVSNSPTRATTFTLRAPHVITLIVNYHWNNGRGATPGTIALRGSDGRTYGTWRTSGSPGQGGVPNAYWNAAPNVTLPAGTYTVLDSDPATWAQNGGSQGSGHTRVEGYPVSGASNSAPITTGSATAAALSVTAELTNSSRENTHIFTENETFGPGNRLAPGEKRRVAVTMKSDGSVTFKAGRNGQVMATKTWRGIPGDSSRVPVVVFDESNPFDKLTVTTGLR